MHELSLHNNYLWHTGLGTFGMAWGGGGGGGEGGDFHIFLSRMRFLTNFLLYGNTKICCYK